MKQKTFILPKLFRILLSFVILQTQIVLTDLFAFPSNGIIPNSFEILEKADFGSGKFVYIVQDLHFDNVCQYRIAEIVSKFIKDRSVDAIALEGANFEKIKLMSFEFYKNNFLSDYMKLLRLWLKKAKISVGEYLSLRFGDEFPIFGLEDIDLYKKQLILFNELYPLIHLKVLKLDLTPQLAYSFVKDEKVVDIYSHFYQLAIDRDKAFVKHLGALLSKNGVNRVVVICGGFHSYSLANYCKQQGISFAVIRPKLFYLSPSSKALYFEQLKKISYSLTTLSLPNRIDVNNFPEQFYRLRSQMGRTLFHKIVEKFNKNYGKNRNSVSEIVKPTTQDINFHFRFPNFVWQKIKQQLRKNQFDENLYYLLRGRGLAWVDITGNIHFIDEFWEEYLPDRAIEISGWLWAIVGNELASIYGLDSMKIEEKIAFARNVILFHEKMHSIFRKHYLNKKRILKEIENFLRNNKISYRSFQSWVSNLYGRPSVSYGLKGMKLFEWYAEEFVVAVLQEYVIRTTVLKQKSNWAEEYIAFLSSNGIKLLCSEEESVKLVKLIVANFKKYFKTHLLTLKASNNSYTVIVDSEDFYKDLGSKKLNNLVSLLWNLSKQLPNNQGEILWQLSWGLFESISDISVRRLGLKASALFFPVFNIDTSKLYGFAHKLGYKGIKNKKDIFIYLFSKAGFGRKEIENIWNTIYICAQLDSIRLNLDERRPLPTATYLNDMFDYYLELTEANINALYLFVVNSILMVEMRSILTEEERSWVFLRLKYFLLPLTERLRLMDLLTRIKDLLFRLQSPGEYFLFRSKVRELLNKKLDKQVIDEISEKIISLEPQLAISADISGRVKSIGSIVEKIKRRSISFSEITDIVGLKIVVPDDYDSYILAKRLSKDLFDQMGEVELFIKSDLRYYNVKGKIDGIPVEVQIKTQSMDRKAEVGESSHWRYNLRKMLPPIWKKQQKFIPDNLELGRVPDVNLKCLLDKIKQNPVVLIVEEGIKRRASFDLYPIRFNMLSRKIAYLTANYDRVFVLEPNKLFNEKLTSSVGEFDLRYYKPEQLLDQFRKAVQFVYLFSKSRFLSSIQEKIIKYQDHIKIALFLFLCFLKPDLLWSVAFFPFAMGIKLIEIPKKATITGPDFKLIITQRGADLLTVLREEKMGLSGRTNLGDIRIYRDEEILFLEDRSSMSFRDILVFIRYLLNLPADGIYIQADLSKLKEWKSAFNLYHYYPYYSENFLFFPKIQQDLSIWVRRHLVSIYEKLLKLKELGLKDAELAEDLWLEIYDRDALFTYIENLLYKFSKLKEQLLVKHKAANHNTLLQELSELVSDLEQTLITDMQTEIGIVRPLSVLRNIIKEQKRRYPNTKVNVEVSNSIPKRLSTYDRIFVLAARTLISNAFKFGSERIDIKIEHKEGELVLKIQDYGRGIPKSIRSMLFKERFPSSLTTTDTGGYSLILLNKLVEKVGGDLNFASLVAGEMVGDYTSQYKQWQKKISASGTGTIFEVKLPSWVGDNRYKNHYKDREPKFIFIHGKPKTMRQWVARQLSAKLNLYYINLDFILYYFLYSLYQNSPLWKAVLSFYLERNDEMLKQIFKNFFSEHFAQKIDFRSDGLYIDGLDSSNYLNEMGLLDEISQLPMKDRVDFYHLVDLYGGFLEGLFAETIKLERAERIFGYNGMVFRTRFLTASDTFSNKLIFMLDESFKEYTPRKISGFCLKALKSPNTLLYVLLLKQQNRLVDYLKAHLGAPEFVNRLSEILEADLPVVAKIKLLNALEAVLRRQASFSHKQSPAVETVEKYLKKFALTTNSEKLKFRTILLLRHLVLYRVMDTVFNKVIPPIIIHTKLALIKNKIETVSSKDILKKMISEQEKIRRLMDELAGGKWSWEDEPMIYAKLLTDLKGLLNEAELIASGEIDLADKFAQVKEMMVKVEQALFLVDWVGDVQVRDSNDLTNLEYHWKKNLSVPIKVRVHMPVLSQDTFQHLLKQLKEQVKVVLHISRVDKAGADWVEEKLIPMKLVGFEQKQWKRNLLYQCKIPFGNLGPGIYEANISASSPAGRIWWDKNQRHYSYQNRFGNIVFRVPLISKKGFIRAVVNKYNLNKAVFIDLNEFGSGYLLNYIKSELEDNAQQILLEVYEVKGLQSLRLIERVRLILRYDGIVSFNPQDLKGPFSNLKFKKHYNSLSSLIKDIRTQLNYLLRKE